MSRKAPVKLRGGPMDGKTIEYYLPLPQMIVVPKREISSATTKFLNYERSGTYEYRFVS